ncbi:hypothetical protein [Laceyella putida]|uniref:DUF1772 domain-containing protein n=1 Tax=Laceyella putida TaxID=110101 RepID=A0ABW2RKK9_9BACL
MKKRHIAFAFSLTQLWVLMSLLGAILCETLMIYPNIFYDIPRSFEIGMKFMVVRGPHDFFPPMGMLAMLTGVGSLIFNWRVKSARYWILGSVMIVFLGEFLLSMAYFWPRNTIMFEEGAAVHSVAVLEQTAQEFQAGHWLRVAGCAAASALSFMGFLKIYRLRILSRDAHHKSK